MLKHTEVIAEREIYQGSLLKILARFKVFWKEYVYKIPNKIRMDVTDFREEKLLK